MGTGLIIMPLYLNLHPDKSACDFTADFCRNNYLHTFASGPQ
jgi:hypothetical protein